jgi:hypothetical protein
MRLSPERNSCLRPRSYTAIATIAIAISRNGGKMQTKQGAVLESLRAVNTFLNEKADQLGDVVHTGVRRKLADVLAELDTHATDQTASSFVAEGATKRKVVLARNLRRRHLTPIARIARVELSHTPNLESLKMPKGRPTPERLIAHAEGMAKAAAPFAETFIEAGLPSDFIARLGAATGELRSAVTDRTQNRGKQNGATTGLKKQLSSARKLVHVLDAFVQTALEDNEPLLASWNVVKRVRRIASQPKAPVTAVTTIAAPTLQVARAA